MMLILRLATRNLFRQVSRNALSMVSIILGVFVIIAGRGFQNGLDENMVRAQIDSASGHVMAVPEGYPTAGFRAPIDGAFPVDESARTWLDANTEAWTPRLVATPRAIVGRDSMQIRLIGVGDTDEQVFPREGWQIDGALPSQGQVLVAYKPAELFGLEPGDLITFEGRTVDGAMNAMRFTVSGIMKTGNPMIDNLTIFMPLSDADALLGAEGRVTHVATRLSRRGLAEGLAEPLAAHLPGTEARTYQDEVGPMIEAQAIRQTMLDFIGLVLLGMAATGIANTVLMAAYERTREIGTLRSMGLRRRGVLALFAVEGAWMGIVGGFVGVVTAGALTWYYSTNGIDMSALMAGKQDAMGNVPMALTLYLQFDVPTLFVAWAVGIVVAVLASVYPAIAASKVSPAEAVRAS